MRKAEGQLCISQIVYLEARNVFSRVAEAAEPEEWRRFISDFNADFNGLLSFDETLKAVAVAERIRVYPPLADEGKRLLSRLKTAAR